MTFFSQNCTSRYIASLFPGKLNRELVSNERGLGLSSSKLDDPENKAFDLPAIEIQTIFRDSDNCVCLAR